MSLILRLIKGSRLTLAELDGNFTYLEGLVKSPVQSSLNASSSLPGSATGITLLCNPSSDMIVTLDHLNMDARHQNYFINESAFTITFVVSEDDPGQPGYTFLKAPNGVVIDPEGTAFLLRKEGANKIFLNISNP
jgi:hypothetical protein